MGVYGERVCTLYNQALISVPSSLEVLVLLSGTVWKRLDSPHTRTELAFLCICLFSDKSMTSGIWELTLCLPFQEKTTKSENRLWKAVLSCSRFLILDIKTREAKDMAVPGTWNSSCGPCKLPGPVMVRAGRERQWMFQLILHSRARAVDFIWMRLAVQCRLQ